MYNLKTWFLKTQLSIWQNRSVTFKFTVYLLKFVNFQKVPTCLWFENVTFLHFQIAIFKKIYFLWFGLKSHFLSSKS
jgi:hypothetical protein